MTSLNCALGHASIRRELRPVGISRATTGEHAHHRIMFKRALHADAVSVVQIGCCRLAGVSEVFVVLLMTAKFGEPVSPHAGSVRLYEHAIHGGGGLIGVSTIIDFVALFGTNEMSVP